MADYVLISGVAEDDAMGNKASMADYVLISGICQWQNGIQISVRHLDEISGVAEDDAMEVFENDYYW